MIASSASSRAAQTAADAARDAAATQARASEQAVAEQQRQYDLTRADLAPWRETGASALNVLVGKVNAGPGDYIQSPGYQFRLSEGEKAVNRSAAARGGALSGATMKALTRYGQDYATADYDNFLRRYYESLNPLQSLAGVGQSSSAQTAAAGSQAAGNISNALLAGGQGQANALLAGGNAAAANAMNQGNIWAGAANSIGNIASKTMDNYQLSNFLKMKYG
jgi:hypothetical protein